MDSLWFRSWKDFSLGWWNALASAWFPSVCYFENLTLWIQLRPGLRDRAWKITNVHSRKLAQLPMTIFLKFWSQDCYPICIHGFLPHCFTCIVEQVTWEVVDMFSPWGFLREGGPKATFTHARGGCGAEAGGFWHSRSHIRGADAERTRSGRGADAERTRSGCGEDAVGSAISWGQWWFGARGFEADAANWEADFAERILLPLRLRSATAHVWTHVMICVEANFPPASARACENVPLAGHFMITSVEMAKLVRSASKTLFYQPVDPDRVISNRDGSHISSCQLTVCYVDFTDSTSADHYDLSRLYSTTVNKA